MYLQSRQYYGYGYNNCYYGNNCYSAWGSWGRWVVLAGVIVVVLLIFFIFSCISARRRRKMGAAPYRGTGWLAPQHGPVNYYGPGGSNTQRPPFETQQSAPPYNASNAGYYGYGQETGTELQPPSNTYQPARGGEPVYAPPEGPPPDKSHIIR